MISGPEENNLQELAHAKDPAFVSAEDFDEACRSLIERSRYVELLGMRLDLRGEQDFRYLIITKALPTQTPSSQGKKASTELILDLDSKSGLSDLDSQPEIDVLDDEDSAAMQHSNASVPTIEYNILLSQSYRVPILYFFLHNLPLARISSIDAIQLVVPEHLRSNLKETGIMGGISMGNHPITDFPSYFVHPCNTAEAMREIIGNKVVSPLEYLQLWIGQVGSCVGLYLPSQLVMERG